MKFKDISGKRFGRLTAIRVCGRNEHCKILIWLCKCDCGKLSKVHRTGLVGGITKSCGCLRFEKPLRHGHCKNNRKTTTYTAWLPMMQRCNPSNRIAFNRYSGRGISVCKRWLKFENFLNDMGSPPAGKTLERINNDLGYSPSNCKWATRIEQMNNTRSNVWIKALGATLTMAQWSRVLGVTESAISSRIYRGQDGRRIIESIALRIALGQHRAENYLY